jgi:hypothetical protein
MDLSPLDFYFWGHVKSIVYATDVPDVNELRNRILLASDQIRNNVDVFENLRTGLLRRARLSSLMVADLSIYYKLSCTLHSY